MFVPLTVDDFLHRAETVFADTVAVVDEPNQPAAPARRAHLPRARRRVRALAGRPGRARRRPGRAGRRRQPELRPAAGPRSSRVRGCGRIARADQLPAAAPTRCATSSSTAGAVGAARRPRARRGAARRATRRTASCSAPRATRWRCASTSSRAPWAGRTRTPPPRSTTPPAPPPGRRASQLTHRNLWLNAVTFGLHLRAWRPRRRTCTRCRCSTCNGWGMPYALAGVGGHAGRAAQGRRRRRSCAASTQHGVTLMGARPGGRGTPCSTPPRDWDGEIPGRGPGAHHRRRRAAARPARSSGSRTSSAGSSCQIYGLTETSPLLTFNRAPRRAETRCRPHERAAQAQPRRRARARGAAATVDVRARCWPARNVVLAGYWDNPEATRRGARGRLVPHRRRRPARRRGLPDDLRPEEGRDHHRRRERLLDRGRGRALQPPGGRRGRRDRRPRREVGRDGQGARRARRRAPTATEAELIAHCKQRLAGYKCPTSVEFRDGDPADGDRQGAEVQAAGALLGGPRAPGRLRCLHGGRRCDRRRPRPSTRLRRPGGMTTGSGSGRRPQRGVPGLLPPTC